MTRNSSETGTETRERQWGYQVGERHGEARTVSNGGRRSKSGAAGHVTVRVAVSEGVPEVLLWVCTVPALNEIIRA